MSTFDKVAPVYMKKFMEDFDCTLEEAAAVFGNLGHESNGFDTLQEVKPTVKGSRGGFGWAQWTGPRRRQYEAYCERNNLDPTHHSSNYKFLWVELKGSEAGAISKLKAATTLEGKVRAFELAYERAGVKHYPSRIRWAGRALVAYGEWASVQEKEKPSQGFMWWFIGLIRRLFT